MASPRRRSTLRVNTLKAKTRKDSCPRSAHLGAAADAVVRRRVCASRLGAGRPPIPAFMPRRISSRAAIEVSGTRARRLAAPAVGGQSPAEAGNRPLRRRRRQEPLGAGRALMQGKGRLIANRPRTKRQLASDPRAALSRDRASHNADVRDAPRARAIPSGDISRRLRPESGVDRCAVHGKRAPGRRNPGCQMADAPRRPLEVPAEGNHIRGCSTARRPRWSKAGPGRDSPYITCSVLVSEKRPSKSEPFVGQTSGTLP